MANYLIIGGSSGIGKSLVAQLKGSNNNIFATYMNTSLSAEESGVIYHAVDISKDFNLDFLPDTLDGMAYCPGRINLKPFHRIPPESFMEDYNIQVMGAVRSIQKALPALKNSEDASIVLFSTVAVQNGFNFHSQISASKGAIEGLTRALAAEFAPGLRVNCIAPSLTDTPLVSKLLNSDAKRKMNEERHPLKRIGRSEDIASMASFLLSDKSGWITGQIMHVDGGMSSIRT